MRLRNLLLSWSAGRGTFPTVLPALGRNDIAAMAFELGWTKGAEIGVWKGGFSEHLCRQHPGLHLLCVDPWQSYPDWQDAKHKPDPVDAQRVMNEAYAKACARLARLNCTIVREHSVVAAASVLDQSLDVVYIDGNHGYQAVLDDLAAWTPKVRRGGAVCGHDFKVSPEKPFIQVVDAVNAFTRERGIDPWFVLGADSSPSFIWEVS